MLATRKANKSNKDDEGEQSFTQMVSQVMNANDFIIDVKPEDLK